MTIVIVALAGIAPATDTVYREAIREHVLKLDGVEKQLLTINYAKVVRALPRSTWHQDAAARAGKTGDAHHDALALPLLGIAALHDEVASSAP